MEKIYDQPFKIKIEDESFLINRWDTTSDELRHSIKCEEIKFEEYEDHDVNSTINDEVSDVGLEHIKTEQHEYENSTNEKMPINSEQPMEANANKKSMDVTTIPINAVQKGMKLFQCSECDLKIALKDMEVSSFYGSSRRKIRLDRNAGVVEEEVRTFVAQIPDHSDDGEDGGEGGSDPEDLDEVTKFQDTPTSAASSSNACPNREVNDGYEVGSDESSSDEEASPHQQFPKHIGTSTDDYATRWRKRDPAVVNSSFQGKPFTQVDLLETPLLYFKTYFDDDLFQMIANESNLYFTQEKLNKHMTCSNFTTTKEEIETYIGMLLYMGIYQLPQYRMYWSRDTPNEHLSKAMSQKRFDVIKKFLHFNDNTKKTEDKLQKIRPMIDSVLNKCQNTEPEEYNSVDEQIIPTKMRSSFKQYLPKKPNKWGYKVFARCGTSGMVYEFEIYTGKTSKEIEKTKLGITGDTVMRLCKTLPQQQNYKIYFDNFFTGFNLLKELRNKGILAVGTMRPNRMEGAQHLLKSKAALQKEGRGSFDWRVDASSNITVIRWHDNSIVQLASTYTDHSLGEKVKRWSSKEKKYLEIECPKMVHEYNASMGGVDLTDMLLSLYRIKVRSRRWYMPIFYYIIKISLTNAWLLYRRQFTDLYPSLAKQKKWLSLLDFQRSVAFDLVNAGKIMHEQKLKRGRPSLASPEPKRNKTSATVAIPTGESRYDGLGHFPDFGKKHRCRFCPNGQTSQFCMKCNVYLCCLPNRNCFYSFHVR